MKHTRRRCDSAFPQDAGRGFTADDADLLCAECLMANRGIQPQAWFTMRMWNLDNVYRVVVTTAEEETEIEFYKLIGASRFWRDGIERSLN